jgi:hypothetical protein
MGATTVDASYGKGGGLGGVWVHPLWMDEMEKVVKVYAYT